MPAVSERQRRWAGAELARLRRGEPTESGMTEEQLREYARKPRRRRKSKRYRKSSRSSKRSR